MELIAIYAVRFSSLVFTLIILVKLMFMLRGVRSSLVTGVIAGVSGVVIFIVITMLNTPPSVDWDDVGRALLAAISNTILILTIYRMVKVGIRCVLKVGHFDCILIKDGEDWVQN